MKDFRSTYMRLVFYAMGIAICLYPVFATDVLVTLDGPTHLYNAAIYNRLLTGDAFAMTYFHINPEPVPNYISHLLLSGLLAISSPEVALKCLHVLLLAGFVFGFSYWNKRKQPTAAILLMLPLVYSQIFDNGFYNFELALVLLFFLLGFYERTRLSGWRKTLLTALLLLLLYLSHSLVFAIGGLLLIIQSLVTSRHSGASLKDTLIHLIPLALAAIPCLLLSVIFMQQRVSTYYFLTFEESFRGLYQAFSLLARGEIAPWLRYLYTATLLVLVFGLLLTRGTRQTHGNYLLWSAGVFLLLYFVLPDSVGYAGVFAIRFNYIFWILLVAWLVRNPFTIEWKNYIPAGIALAFLFVQLQAQLKHWKSLDRDAALVADAFATIPEESVVYPIFASNAWNHFHLSNIGGVASNLMILENNGARNSYFPVIYNAPYEDYLSEQHALTDQRIPGGVHYVFVMGTNPIESEKDRQLMEQMEQNGTCIFRNQLTSVWEMHATTK